MLPQLGLQQSRVPPALFQGHRVLLPQPRGHLHIRRGPGPAALGSPPTPEPLGCPEEGWPLLSPHNHYHPPTQGNLKGILQESLQLLELLQLAATGPGSLYQCLFPARRRVSWALRSPHRTWSCSRGVHIPPHGHGPSSGPVCLEPGAPSERRELLLPLFTSAYQGLTCVPPHF